MNLFKTYLSRYQLSFFGACVNSTINKLLDLMPPLLVGWLVNSLSGTIPGWFKPLGVVNAKEAVLFIIALTVVIFLLESLFEWFYNGSFKRIAQKVQHDVRLDLYAKVQKLPQTYFENNRLGNMLSILNEDVNQLERFLNTNFNEILQMLVLFIFAFFALTSISFDLALIGMAPIPFIIIVSVLYQKMIAPKYQKMRQTAGWLNSRLENNLSGIREVKMFNAEKYEQERVTEASLQYKEDNFSIILYNVAYNPLIRIFVTAGFAIGLLVAANWVLQDNGKMTLGGVALYAMLIQRLLWPITRLGQIFDDYERSRASVKRIEQIFAQADEPGHETSGMVPDHFDTLEVKNLDFSYQLESGILYNVSFKVRKGESVGIVGPTGAGKTTLIKLISRLYEPNKGEILIDGRNLNNFNLSEWRSQISIVNQDAYLFHGSIKENIAYSQPNVEMNQIIEASKMAYLHDFVSSLPNGYDSLIGERGIKLSGGQRQRLSLARAILKNAPLLILDEATSAVDTQTEKAIQENIEVLSKDKTLIVIAHRLSTVRNTNSILVLDNGRIVESGNHETLLAKQDGIYRHLWNIQTGIKSSI
jgi:ATP-binding cassette subfamily B protein